jgi:exonuclease SbcC
MRPLRLAIHGLRSYRRECVIDFMDRSLIAIVGDTGAGKSSILEAITYALYNSSTWSAGETRALIADGMQTMKVELDFQAGGHTWRVLRSTSRGGYPPPTHRLECLDDGPAAPPLIGEDAVRRQVEKLLGMNRKAFLSAVILPQGRFQALLQEEPTERTRILKGIFRLDELESVRGAADGLRRRVEPVLAELRGRRSALPADPQADANRLRQELALLGEQEEGLSSVLRLVQEAQQAARDAQPEIRALPSALAPSSRSCAGGHRRHAWPSWRRSGPISTTSSPRRLESGRRWTGRTSSWPPGCGSRRSAARPCPTWWPRPRPCARS